MYAIITTIYSSVGSALMRVVARVRCKLTRADGATIGVVHEK